MRGTIVRIGVTGASALLALGIVAAAPAGASNPHTDRPVAGACTPSERVQGNSSSDPDGTSNGGADKPGCPGGFDLDKDGNNGCGNDADREDDNNGHCGRKPAGDKAKPAPTSSSTSSTSTTTTTTTTVAGTLRAAGSGTTDIGTATVSATDAAATSAGDSTVQADAVTVGEPQTEVLGQTLERPSVLARTGAGLGGLALLGGLLCGGGRLAVLARRFLRID